MPSTAPILKVFLRNTKGAPRSGTRKQTHSGGAAEPTVPQKRSEMARAKSERISAAAEELVRAAGIEVDSSSPHHRASSQKLLATNLASLKESFDSKLDSISEIVDSSNKKFDAKIDVVNKNIADLKEVVEEKIESLNETLQEHQKIQTLQWAIENTEYGSFDYYTEKRGEKKSSKDLVKTILFRFRRGCGCYIEYGRTKESEPSTEKDFRDKLFNQVLQLTGVRPRLEKKEKDGRYCIYFS